MPQAPAAAAGDAPAAAGFNVNGKFYAMPETLTMGEMCDAEQFFGVEFGNNKSSGVRLAAAMLWIAIKREDPTVTPDDVRELPPEVFDGLSGAEDDALPPASDELAIVKEDDELEKSEHSGNGSRSTGDDPAEIPAATGTQG